MKRRAAAAPSPTEIVYQAEGGLLEKPETFTDHTEAKAFARENKARVRSTVRVVNPTG